MNNSSSEISKGTPTVSVIIPCYPPHAHHLENLILQMYLQTRQPDQICIGMSELSEADGVALQQRLQELVPIPIEIITTDQPARASVNRNNASLLASGDYIFYVDADDSYHPQCIEALLRTATRTSADVIMMEYGKLSGELDTSTLPIIPSAQLFEYTFPNNSRDIDGELAYRWSPIIKAGIEGSPEYEGRGAHHGIVFIRRELWEETPQRDVPGREDAIWLRDLLWNWSASGRKTTGFVYLPVQLIQYSKQAIYQSANNSAKDS